MATLKDIIKLYDSFSWLPTIRGALSLDIINGNNNVLGDVDKFVVTIKQHYGLQSAHYIAATSLHTVNDSKVTSDYVRTFRYFFIGSIHDENEKKDFLKEYGLMEDNICDYYTNDGFLLGHLIIVTELTYQLSNLEVQILSEMQSLVKDKIELNDLYYIKAASMGELAAFRSKMVEKWKKINGLIHTIKYNDDDKPTYCFDVFLTRDGILLLKDKTDKKYKVTTYSAADDYTKNIPLHRIFKVAMNYVKYLFHSNYHHNKDHDTCLPASNLYPYRNQQNDNNLTCVFRHQMDAFLNPVVKLKRNNFRDYTIDPKGVILYAHAFINVFRYNKLIEDERANKAESFLKIQEQEIDHMQHIHRSKVDILLSQKNLVIIVSSYIAFTLASLSIIKTLKDLSFINCTFIHNNINIIFYMILFVGGALFTTPRILINRLKFTRTMQSKNNILFGNSNLDKAKFSWRYQKYIEFSPCIDKWRDIVMLIFVFVVLVCIGIYLLR